MDSLGIEELSLVGMEIKKATENMEPKTYSMDPFLEDEIRTSKEREVLLLTFRAKDPSSYLNYDLMSYVVSRVQWELPEFWCVGELA